MTTYAWSGPNSFSASTQNPIISSVTTAANGTYTLTVTNASGCTASATTAVTINALPVPNPSSDSPKCVGTTLTFGSVAGMTTYAWSGPNSFSASTQNPSISSVTTAANGTYTLTVTNANGCTASATTSVTINALPVPNPSSDSPKCVGTTLTFGSVAGMSTYAWSGPNSFSASTQNPSISNVTTAANGTYTLTVSNASGCTASATTAVTINALPVPNPSSDSPKCVGTTLTFGSVAGMTTYAWSGPNSFSASTQNPGISSVTTAANGTYTLTVTNANGCTASATTAVTINALPVPNPSSDSPKCVGTTLTFGSVAGMTTYAWSGPNSFSASTQIPSISSVTASANGTYTLTVTNASGCTASATTGVIVNESLPPLIEEPLQKVVCAPSTITQTASKCLGMVTWSQGGVTGTTLILSVPGNYSISATCTSNGCVSVASSVISGLTINEEVKITTSPNNVSICQGNNATFTVQTNQTGVSYQWEVNTGSGFVAVAASTVYSGQNTATLSLAFPTISYNNYQYRCVVSKNGCNATSGAVTLSMSGSAEALNIVNISPISGVYSQTAVAYTVALNKIEPNANVTYKSGNAIEFLPGFETRAGAVFQTKIESTCGNTSSKTTNFDNLPKEIRK